MKRVEKFLSDYRKDFIQLDMFVHTTRNKVRNEKDKSKKTPERTKGDHSGVHKEYVEKIQTPIF
jgi:hypothetical protein